MIDEKKLFDADDLEDVPDSVREQLRKKSRITELHRQILELFEDRDELSLDEIILGLYRKHGITIKRESLKRKIAFLISRDNPKIETVEHKKSVYRKTTTYSL